MEISPEAIVTEARLWLGTRYHHQGRLRKSQNSEGGVDCFGLIIGVAKELKIKGAGNKPLAEFDITDYSPYPDSTRLKNFLNKHLISVRRKPKLGDVLVFKIFDQPQHLGICSNYGEDELGIIHCHSGAGKVVEHILSPAWGKMLAGVYRFRG